jgi:hypothetical protein
MSYACQFRICFLSSPVVSRTGRLVLLLPVIAISSKMQNSFQAIPDYTGNALIDWRCAVLPLVLCRQGFQGRRDGSADFFHEEAQALEADTGQIKPER